MACGGQRQCRWCLSRYDPSSRHCRTHPQRKSSGECKKERREDLCGGKHPPIRPVAQIWLVRSCRSRLCGPGTHPGRHARRGESSAPLGSASYLPPLLPQRSPNVARGVVEQRLAQQVPLPGGAAPPAVSITVPGHFENFKEAIEKLPSDVGTIMVHPYLTQCINQMVSFRSTHPQTHQLNFITRNGKIKLTDLWVN